jgi:hypothetical protein
MRLASYSTPTLTAPFANQATGLSFTQPAAFLPNNVDTFQVIGIHPPAAVHPVQFGLLACGICPICVAGAQAQKELNKIKALRDGKDDIENVLVKVGQGALGIRQSGAKTGSNVGTNFIGNEDGTRVQRLSAKDLQAFLNAILPRIYHHPNDTSYHLVANPHHRSGGVENGLRKQLIQGLEQTEHTEAFTEERTPSLQEHLLHKLDEKVKAFGLYHHIAEGQAFRKNNNQTIPLLVGYTSSAKLEDHALFVPSLREMPGFEELGVTPGGLMNMLAMAAKHEELTHIKIAVEPSQHELKKYIATLKEDYGYDIHNLSEEKKVPAQYRDAMAESNMTSGTELYEIPLKPLKDELAKLPTAKEEPDPGKRDTSLIKTIQLPDPKKDLLFERLKKTLNILPRLHEITLFRPLRVALQGLSDE